MSVTMMGPNITRIETLNNVVSFCECSLDRPQMDAMIRADRGVGLDAPGLEVDLQAGNYIPVLRAVWCERDRARRVAWLREHAWLHAPLLFELAVAELRANPTAETVTLVSLPLIHAAIFRVAQDAECSTDISVSKGDAHQRMSITYCARLRALVPDLDVDREARIAACRARVIATARLSQTAPLPPPTWIGWHGLDVVLGGAPSMHPAAEHAAIRDRYAANTITAMERMQAAAQ